MKTSTSQVEERFSDFYAKWMAQLEDLLQLLLLLVSRGQQQADNQQAEAAAGYEAVVNKLTAHHKEYYTVKWASAREDVLPFFCPAWLSPLENAYQWVTGWKPSMAFRLLDSMAKLQPAAGAVCLSEEQMRKIMALRAKIKMEEEKVEREMERQQVALADRKIVELTRMEVRAEESGGGGSSAAVKGLVEVALMGTLSGLERVMKMADCVRLKTLKGLLEIMSPMQSVDFLASKSMLQIRMRKWGKMRQARMSQ